MAKRLHAGAARIDAAVLERVKLAARLLGVSAADYLSRIASQAAERDIAKATAKLTSEQGQKKPRK